MTEEILIAGFGGQGILMMGKVLAYSGILQGLEASWMPSYGPEMRGGTANVTVIISDEQISSPILNSYDTVIALNQPSLDKFENKVKPGGILIYEPNGITRHPSRKDISIYKINATEEAVKLGLSKVFNMFILGGFLKIKPIVDLNYVHLALEKSIPSHKAELIQQNKEAIQLGFNLIQKVS